MNSSKWPLRSLSNFQKCTNIVYSNKVCSLFNQVYFILFVNYNQQAATIFDYLFLKGSTYFGRFLRPSSGAHNCTLSFRYCQPLLLQAGIVGEMDLVASCCILLLVIKKILLTMHGHMNIKLNQGF
jgi:hypothetical protein